MHPVLIYSGIYFIALIVFLFILEAIDWPPDIKIIISFPAIVSYFLGRWLVKRFPYKDAKKASESNNF